MQLLNLGKYLSLMQSHFIYPSSIKPSQIKHVCGEAEVDTYCIA